MDLWTAGFPVHRKLDLGWSILQADVKGEFGWLLGVSSCTTLDFPDVKFAISALMVCALAGDTLSSRHVSSCDVNACSWDVRGDLTLNSMVQIHISVTLLTSRDLAWNSGRLTCQHASKISAVAHIS